MISCSIVLILSILYVASVFKRFCGNKSVNGLNCCLGLKIANVSACFFDDL